jgi:hypothetical protein
MLASALTRRIIGQYAWLRLPLRGRLNGLMTTACTRELLLFSSRQSSHHGHVTSADLFFPAACGLCFCDAESRGYMAMHLA